MSNIGSVQPGQGPESTPPPESKAERQKLFELQWEISLLGIVDAVSNKNGNVQHQLGNLKQSMVAGQPPEKLLPAVNQVIDQLNQGLPPFDLTSGGNENKAITQYTDSVERYINLAAEKGKISSEDQEHLTGQTHALIEQIGTIPTTEAMHTFNSIIDSANQALPAAFQLPRLGK